MPYSASPHPLPSASSASAQTLLSRLMQLAGRPQSSQRTIIQGLDLVCRTLDVEYGLVGRLDVAEDRLETVGLYAPHGWISYEESLKQAAVRSMMQEIDGGLPARFDYVDPQTRESHSGCSLPLIWQGELIGLLILLCPTSQAKELIPYYTILQGAAGFFSLVLLNQILSTTLSDRSLEPAPASSHPPMSQSKENADDKVREFSHDLRSPLGAILTCADLLIDYRSMIAPERLDQLLQMLQQSAQQAIHLLNDFQDQTVENG